MLIKGLRALLMALFLFVGIGTPFASASDIRLLSDPELDEIFAAGLFFNVDLLNGFMRLEILSSARTLDGVVNSRPSADSTSTGVPTSFNVGNAILTDNAQQNLRAVGNVVAANSAVNLLINILVVNIQNNSAPLHILQPQFAGNFFFGF